MKQILITIMLIIMISLVGCANTNSGNNENNINYFDNESGNIVKNEVTPTPIHKERLSYEEYVNKNENIVLLSTYSSPLNNSSDERKNNIEIVCDRLNNFILKPKETFSYNDTCRSIWSIRWF